MNELQQSILRAALTVAPFEGWTIRTLEKAAEKCGIPAIDAHRAFPSGVIQCLNLFNQDADAAMLTALAKEYNLSSMKIRERIATGVMVRLTQNLAHREAIRRGLAYYALPWNIPHGTKALYHTVDAMWIAAGDQSTDFNFYTKRGLLAKVYLTTLLHWLNDESNEQQETRAFLMRRIEDVMQIQKVKGKISQSLEHMSWFSLFRQAQG